MILNLINYTKRRKEGYEEERLNIVEKEGEIERQRGAIWRCHCRSWSTSFRDQCKSAGMIFLTLFSFKVVLGSLLRSQNIGNIRTRVALMSKCLENCWWLCNTIKNYILTHLKNVYKAIKLSWKWLETRKDILLLHWRCRNFNTPPLVKLSTKIGNSLRRF